MLPLSVAARWAVIGLEASLAGVAWILGRLLGSSPWETVALDFGDAFTGAAASVPVLAAVGVAVLFPVGPLRSLVRMVDELLVPLFEGWTLLEMMAVSLAAGVGEELLFRGVVLHHTAARFGMAAGLGLSSLLFGLVHFLSPAYFVFATLMGVYLGLLYWWCDNLLPAIVTHALYDFVVLVYVGRLRRAEG